jgi:uncharacterized membrane protein
MKRMMTRGIFAAAVAAAMGFGAAQAVAAPAENAGVRGCTQESCAKRCAPLTGFCEPRGCWCR